MSELLTPAECYEAHLPQLQALMFAILTAPTHTPGLALSMLYGLFVFTLRAFDEADMPMTPQQLADLLAEIEEDLVVDAAASA